ncbi:unnamed protein product [Phytophthora lilii]|uniref:Unnamed protein product n=1 Tax=Phytophthora lilii TaxID=2077276 RepID=A0A9W6X0G8_9STRA|nr:unnamed protein product [Phytophthora lilii]
MRLFSPLGLAVASCAVALRSSLTTASMPRCFHADFLFGSATASYQVEGAWNEDGRTPSIWDDFCRVQPGFECANVADDFYHRYADDIKLMLETGLQSFRFSVSWSRVLNWDHETRRMQPNAPGLLTPQGWLNPDIIGHFVQSSLLYHEFGDKVAYWTTFNEPLSFVVYGYNTGLHPPGFHDSPTLVYEVAHNVLLSHGYAVQKFRELKSSGVIQPKARIGIVLNAKQFYPLDASNPKDVEATERAMNFESGWWLLPLTTGDYPAVMRERVGERLPRFTAEQAALLKGSYDVFMLNHYYSRAITDCDSEASNTPCSSLHVGFGQDKGVDDTHIVPGSHPGQETKGNYCQAYTAYPPGYLDTIKWMHAKDQPAEILLTENGWCGDDAALVFPIVRRASVQGCRRGEDSYHRIHRVVVLDNYEWGSYGPRFGLYYVNFTEETGSPDFEKPNPTDLQRIARPSAKWFSKLASTGCLDELTQADASAAIATRAAARQEFSTITGASSSSGLLPAGIMLATAAVGAAMLAATWRRRQGYADIPRFSTD